METAERLDSDTRDLLAMLLQEADADGDTAYLLQHPTGQTQLSHMHIASTESEMPFSMMSLP